MASIPRDHYPDSTLSLLWHGYRFIPDRCDALRTDIFSTRLLLRKTICMRGAEATQLFYDNDKFIRHGAMPTRAQKTLTGEDGVQSLDGNRHRQRKKLFVSELMNAGHIAKLVEINRTHWLAAISQWPLNEELVLFDQAQKILCKSVCVWAGIPLAETALEQRAKEFGLMIDSGARLGLHHWRGRLARQSSEQWIKGEIERIRAGDPAQQDTIARAFAWHRDEHGNLLAPEVAAVELINVLRPTVAIAQLVAYSVLALREHPHSLIRILNHHPDYLDWFVLEVRRFYPFFPFLAAYTSQDFSWKGFDFAQGTLVLLDIYGTNHDSKLWQNPGEFNPDRFKPGQDSSDHLLANGNASYDQHHRCPGEWITNALLKVALQTLTENLVYEIPEQDLRISLRDIPTLPQSRVVIKPVKVMPVK